MSVAGLQRLESLRSQRATQGLRVANAGKGKRREVELTLYRKLDAAVAALEETLGVAGFPTAMVVPDRSSIEDAADADDLPF